MAAVSDDGDVIVISDPIDVDSGDTTSADADADADADAIFDLHSLVAQCIDVVPILLISSPLRALCLLCREYREAQV